MFYKFLSVLLTAVLLVAGFCVEVNAEIGDISFTEVEPNNTMATADRIQSDYTVGGILNGVDLDYFKFTVTKESIMRLLGGSSYTTYTMAVLNSSEDVVAACYTNEETDGMYFGSAFARLQPGTYYVAVFDSHEDRRDGIYVFYLELLEDTTHQHSYTSVTTPPTCASQGYTTYTCSCGDSYVSNYVAERGHNYVATGVVVEANCATKGSTQYRCTNCASVYNEVTSDALGHNYVRTIVEPTCTKRGYTSYVCSRCSDSYRNDYVPSHGHEYTFLKTVAPTCSEGGYDVYACRHCGNEKTQNAVEARHTLSGKNDVVCDVCGAFTYRADYPDVKEGQWYCEAVSYVSYYEFMTGYGSGKFGPADNLKRQDFVVALARLEGADLSVYANADGGLKDVVKGSYYAPAVAWAVDNDIVKGYDSGRFGVGESITREQVCTILHRYLGHPTVENEADVLRSYPDKNRVSPFARTAMAWAIDNDIISGMGNGKLAPTVGASRAQIATILMRMDKAGMFS